jgi:2-oxoglutarate dehydrogenase E2 component (dihydrolipoamide succinyltransferase)
VKVEMLMPQMGESIAEARISRWLKAPGDKVERDEIILEISTDKVDSEIPAPAAGVIAELLFKEGDVVPVKTKIAVIDTEGQAGVAAAPASKPAAEPVVEIEKPAKAEPVKRAPVAAESAAGSRFYSPLVKGLAAKYDISMEELESIPGTGQGGRLTKEDLMNYINQEEAAPTPATETRPAVSQPAPVAPAPAKQSSPRAADLPSDQNWNSDRTKVIPMDNMRRAIAEHMVRSKHTSPHVYSVQEVDVTNISKWRKKYKDEFQANEGFGLSFTPFFLEAAVKALLKFPHVNASVEGNSIILKKYVNLGCAVALANSGLIVPVIKNADEKNLVGIARGLNDLALRARNKKLLPDDIMNGTFTVTNPGVFGTIIGTPIINQPQVAILCLGAIEKRPVVIDDMIAIRERCYLTLSYDHRIIDGSLGGQFLAFIREYLEGWDMERSLYS